MASVPPAVKEKFMRRLKKIKTTKYTLQFCTMLSESQKMNKECEDNEKIFYKSQQHSEQFLFDIKNILKQEPAEKIVKSIFKALRAHKEESPLKEQLLNCLKSGYEVEPTKYLNQLIEYLESIIKLCNHAFLYGCYLNGMGGESNLDTLKKLVLNYGNEKNGVILTSMFWLGVSTLDFSLEEKKEVKDLLIEAMPYSTELIRSSVFRYDELTAFGLMRTSGLHFLRDLLEDYSNDSQIKILFGKFDDIMATLKNLASYFNPALDCSHFDLNIPAFIFEGRENNCKKDIPDTSVNVVGHFEEVSVYNLYFEEDFEDICHNIVDMLYFLGGQYVPKTHFWWKNYMKEHLEHYDHASPICISNDFMSFLF